MEFKRISIDTSKHVFTIQGVDEEERPVLRREIRRAQVEPFFAKLAPTEVILEACQHVADLDAKIEPRFSPARTLYLAGLRPRRGFCPDPAALAASETARGVVQAMIAHYDGWRPHFSAMLCVRPS